MRYEDNWDAVMIFCNMQTQRKCSMQGGMFDLYNITDRRNRRATNYGTYSLERT